MKTCRTLNVLLGVMLIGLFVFTDTAICKDGHKKEKSRTCNAGQILLLEICSNFGIPATLEELDELMQPLAGSRGKTTFLGIKKALQAKGLKVKGLKADIEKLNKLFEEGLIITTINMRKPPCQNN